MKLLVVAALALGLATAPAPAQSAEPTPKLVNTAKPTITGTPRLGHRLTMSIGQYSPRATKAHVRWYRDGRKIPGAFHRAYRPTVNDVGHRLQVRVYATRAGHRSVRASSASVHIGHISPERKVVTYSVVTRGKIVASVSNFKKLAQETYDHPLGWRANGIRFKRVAQGGDFTLVLANASTVRSYSSVCSATWSCRVGRYVIINQDRWRLSSLAWKRGKGSLRGYQHMVINHETGHWLGKGHASCTVRGAAAPVMQQQSKGLGGCTINSWPKKSERYAPRFRF